MGKKRMGILDIKRDIKDIRRFDEILLILFEEGFGYLLGRFELMGRIPFHKRLKPAQKKADLDNPERLRKTLERLGPTFVKLGQMLSLRPDLIPEEYCKEFALLQDRVAQIPFLKVRKIVEAELHKPLGSVFRSFEARPIAAASIAQVHKAVLRDGTKVAVKVRRPGIDSVMQADIDIMEALAGFLEHREELRNFNLREIVAEFRRYTRSELDLSIEARNAMRIRENFKSFPGVLIPRPFTALATPKVLVMEFVDGIEVRSVDLLKKRGYSTKQLARIGVRSVVKQIFVDRFFHADSHPSNLIAVSASRLAYVDFGIVGRISEKQAKQILLLTFAVLDEDTDRVVDLMLGIGVPTAGMQPEAFRSEAGELLEAWYGTSLKEERITTVMYRVMMIAVKNGIKLPVDVVLLAKALVTMEGTCLVLDPEFNFFREVKDDMEKVIAERPFASRAVGRVEEKLREFSVEAEDFPDKVARFVERLERGNIGMTFDVEQLRSAFREYGSASSRGQGVRTISIVFAALLLSSSVLFASGDYTKIFNIRLAYIQLSLAAALGLLLLVRLSKK